MIELYERSDMRCEEIGNLRSCTSTMNEGSILKE